MSAADRSLPPLLILFLPSSLLICLDGPLRAAAAEGGGLSSPPSPLGDNGVSAAVGDTSALATEAQFFLKVLARDLVTRRPLAGVSVDVYLNHTSKSSAQTGEDGEVLLRVPYDPGVSLTLLGSKEGYVPTPLPWTTTRRPIFSAVTLPLLPHSQGNIWLFEDSVLITRSIPDRSSQPKAKFPKNLLTVSDKSNISSLTAYLTVPQHHLAKDRTDRTPGIVSSKSALRSVELKAVAAVSIQLYSGGEELQVRGPVQISLPLERDTHSRSSNTVPAWAFDPKTGAWENHGLGTVEAVGDELVWTYTASHLGYWIAAPHPSAKDYFGHASSMDFISYHTYLLVGILGGTLSLAIGFLSWLLCHCGGSRREATRRRRARFSKLTVAKKDQTTSTHAEEGLLLRPGDNGLTSRSVQCEPLSTPRHKANYNIYVEDPGSFTAAPPYDDEGSDRTKGTRPPPHYIDDRRREKEERNRADPNSDSFFRDKAVHAYNRPPAIVQAPEPFGAQEQQPPGRKAATFPRNGAEHDAHREPASKEGYAQTLAKVHRQGGSSPQRGDPDEPRPPETPPPGQGPAAGVWGRYSNLLESSVSVPGTLNEAAGTEAFGGGHRGELQGISERTLLELTRGKSSAHPRAWFVSLDGKPAAQVRHSIIELQSRHRPPSSNDTSLDSGVDMNEPPQNVRDVERDRPSTRGSSLPRHGRGGRYGEEQDPSSSESGTTATCTPEDPSLRNILDGSSGAIPNIPEERDGTDTSSAREDSESKGTPPPRRLRKARERGKAEKRSAKHVREGRPLTKRS
ncbi:protein FAM171B [Poeciliopsis prolifica]|uniref:protein FAM171B n=1 Tax=Poeciliopsis prolifica TaxID=188132 RepID=UPI0024145169|nr:protein FAM171B [Poeciliopsis prolifica]